MSQSCADICVQAGGGGAVSLSSVADGQLCPTPWDPHPSLLPTANSAGDTPSLMVTAGLASLSQHPWPSLLPIAMAGPAWSPPQDQSSSGHLDTEETSLLTVFTFADIFKEI